MLRVNKHDGRKHPLANTEEILAEFLRRAAILQNYPKVLWDAEFKKVYQKIKSYGLMQQGKMIEIFNV